MKKISKFVLFFVISIFQKKKRFIILNPDLTSFGIKKVIIFDKKKSTFSSYKIRDKYDFITVEEIFFYESYKLDDLKIFSKIKKDIIDKELLIIDCGSNIGCSTNYFLNTFDNSKIISIEPDLGNFNMLKSNVENNKNLVIINNAISNENINYIVESSLENNKDNRGKRIIGGLGQNFLKSLTINQILAEKNNQNFYPFLVKIDVEGHEKNLFLSNTEWFNKFKIVIVEIHDWMLPGQSISRGYLNVITESMKKFNRDTIIKGENLISIKINDI